jgi:hypothetical protein
MDVKGYLGKVIFDGQTVIVKKRMSGESRILVASIVAVEAGPAGLGMRFIRFATAASATRNTAPFGKHEAMANDPNALTYSWHRKAEFEELAAAVQAAMREGATTPGAPPPGWYPAGDGSVRWWGGNTWGPAKPG